MKKTRKVMNRSRLFYLTLSCMVFFASCKKDEGLKEEQKDSYIKYYGGSTTASEMIPTADGGFVMVGTSTSGLTDDIVLVKADEYGNQQWIRFYNGPNNLDDEGNGVVVTPNGGYAIIGTTIDIDSVGNFAVEVKKAMLLVTDAMGNPITDPKLYGLRDSKAQLDTYGNGIALDASDNYVIAGEITNRFSQDNIGLGLLISSTSYAQNGIVYCFIEPIPGTIINIGFKDVIQASNGHYIFVGNSAFTQSTSQDKNNIWITDYEFINNNDTSGVGNFNVFGGLEDDEAFSVIENSAGHYMVSGYKTEDELGAKDKNGILIEAASPASDPQLWESVFGESGTLNASDDIYYNCFPLSDGYAVAGMTQSGGAGQLYLVRLNLTGDVQWTQNYGYVGLDEARTVCQTSDGGFLLFGTAQDERGNPTMCTIKTDSKGDLVIN